MIDWTKAIQTWDGRPARMIRDDRIDPNGYRYVVLFEDDEAREQLALCNSNGEGWGRYHQPFVRNIVTTHVWYVNWARGTDGTPLVESLHATAKEASDYAAKYIDSYFARTRVEITEGKFDE